MAKLTTLACFNTTQMMLNPRKSAIDDFKDEVLRLLPEGTMCVGIQELPMVDAYRSFTFTFESTFFKKDFSFEVEFKRETLTDGEILHQYRMATKIIKLSENEHGK